ncbi:hypothetical protein BU204_18605 [Actinophytocola xanthii]|uniref:Uncharacterized protein n=2 Tax=Actinophytocola xanthii TaxID=1912961 RepID=A0A1Q8CP69_9PSEU|nr:hypothetical protein BU204_18605 [Actinophytocola xanthii]
MVAQRFRYSLPATPVAGAAVDIGHLAVRIDLVLTGELDLVGTAPEASTEESLRACALRTVRDMSSGVMVRGLGSATPSLRSSAGHVFTQLRHAFPGPATVAFDGECVVDFGRRCGTAEVTVRGTVGYSLEVTALSTAGKPLRASGNGRNWFVQHDRELASIGMVVLVAVPIAPARLVAAEGV